MPQSCAAVSCNHTSINCKLKKFPSDTIRALLWETHIRRSNWKRQAWDKVCQCHFDEDQFEKNRADGLVKLRPDAIPLVFPTHTCSKKRRFNLLGDIIFHSSKKHNHPDDPRRVEDLGETDSDTSECDTRQADSSQDNFADSTTEDYVKSASQSGFPGEQTDEVAPKQYRRKYSSKPSQHQKILALPTHCNLPNSKEPDSTSKSVSPEPSLSMLSPLQTRSLPELKKQLKSKNVSEITSETEACTEVKLELQSNSTASRQVSSKSMQQVKLIPVLLEQSNLGPTSSKLMKSVSTSLEQLGLKLITPQLTERESVSSEAVTPIQQKSTHVTSRSSKIVPPEVKCKKSYSLLLNTGLETEVQPTSESMPTQSVPASSFMKQYLSHLRKPDKTLETRMIETTAEQSVDESSAIEDYLQHLTDSDETLDPYEPKNESESNGKEIQEFRSKVGQMQKKIWNLEQELHHKKKQVESLEKSMSMFGPDQLKLLECGFVEKWSDETMLRALEIRYKCGIEGYKTLLKQGWPLPCYSALCKRIQRKKESGLLTVTYSADNEITNEAVSRPRKLRYISRLFEEN